MKARTNEEKMKKLASICKWYDQTLRDVSKYLREWYQQVYMQYEQFRVDLRILNNDFERIKHEKMNEVYIMDFNRH